MNNELERPKVGLGVMIMKEGKVLVGRRSKDTSHGSDLYSFPGGHLENGESFAECAKRETLEEAGIEIENLEFVMAFNSLQFLPKHFVCFGFKADWKAGEPRPEKDDKMLDWDWYDLDALPSPMYEPSRMVIDAYRQGIAFIDAAKH